MLALVVVTVCGAHVTVCLLHVLCYCATVSCWFMVADPCHAWPGMVVVTALAICDVIKYCY